MFSDLLSLNFRLVLFWSKEYLLKSLVPRVKFGAQVHLLTNIKENSKITNSVDCIFDVRAQLDSLLYSTGIGAFL